MKDLYKLAVVGLVAGLASGLVVGWLVSNQPDLSLGQKGTRFPAGVSVGTTTSPAGSVTQGNLNVGGESFLDGTTTIAKSFDGFVVGGVFGTFSTNTPVTLYTHSGGPAFCNGATGILYANGGGVFAPGLVVGVGTSTGSVPTNNLISTTTNVANIATTTGGSDSVALAVSTTKFRLNVGDKIIGLVQDSQAANSSSTYFTNQTMEFKIHCWLSDI